MFAHGGSLAGTTAADTLVELNVGGDKTADMIVVLKNVDFSKTDLIWDIHC
jgi:hypothetical protein